MSLIFIIFGIKSGDNKIFGVCKKKKKKRFQNLYNTYKYSINRFEILVRLLKSRRPYRFCVICNGCVFLNGFDVCYIFMRKVAAQTEGEKKNQRTD